MAWLTVLGIPALVYIMSITALLFHMSGRTQNPLLLIGAGFVTAAVYIFHRSLIQAVEPMQPRHRLAVLHKKKLLCISSVLFLFAIAIFALRHPFETLLVFGSAAGIVVYGRNTFIKPLRTFKYIKPLAVGTAITFFAWALNDFSNSTLTVVAFVLMCSADALVCDLVDCEYDAATGCNTLALQLGEYRTKILATAAYALASVGLLVAIEHHIIGLYIFIVFVVSLAFSKFDSRYVVDLRLLLVLMLAWVEWLFWTGQLQ